MSFENPDLQTTSQDSAPYQPPTGLPQDSGFPRLPAPQGQGAVDPTAPPASAPNLGAPQGTFSQKLASALQATASHPDAPAVAAQPGGWSRLLVGGVMDALSNNLGDASAAGKDVRPGSGFLGGFAKAAAARGQRVAGQQQQQIENQQRQQQNAREDKVANANIARAQTDTLLAQQTLRHADSDAKRSAYAADQAVTSDLEGVNTPKLATGLDSDGISKWYAENPNDRNKATVVVDHLNTDRDAQGNEFLRPVYTIYGEIPEVPLSPESAALLNKYHPKDQPYTAGLQLPGSNYIVMMKQAKLAQAQDLASQKLISEVRKNMGEGDSAEQTALDKATKNQYGVDIAPEMQHVGGDPVRALDELKKSKDPAAIDMSRKITSYYGGDVIARLTEAKQKEAGENVRHAADMAQKTSDARQTAGLNQILKDTEKVGDVFKQNDSAKRNIASAKTGDELASQMVPLMTALGVSTFAGVHRVNTAEIDNAGPQVGSYYRRLNNLLNKVGKGTLSPDSLKEANDLFDRLNSTAYDHYAAAQAFTAAQRGLPDSTLILDRNGIDTTTIGDVKKQRAAASLPAAPDGQVSVQIPGQPAGFIPAANLQKFRQTHPDAIVGGQQ